MTVHRTLRRFLILTGVASLIVDGPSILIAQSSLRPTAVEVTVPAPPTPVAIDGRVVLAYELHVTNFARSPIALRRIDVFSERDRLPLVTSSDSSLRSAIVPVGGSTDVTRLEIGRQLIVYMWVDLGKQTDAALRIHRLRHRLAFVTYDTGSVGKEAGISAIDSVSVAVADGPVPVLGAPVRSGEWYAGSGPSNTADHRRSITAFDARTFIAQRFATDWVKIGPNGDTHHDGRATNENFWAYGEPVIAVADGVVTAAVDSIAENTPGRAPALLTPFNIAGNHVILRIAPHQYVLFAHLKAGSVRVKRGQRIQQGTPIGQLGNSGSSTAPHLHLQVMDRNSPLGAEGLPFVFDRYDFLGFGKVFEEHQHPTIPTRRQLPPEDAVVRFR